MTRKKRKKKCPTCNSVGIIYDPDSGECYTCPDCRRQYKQKELPARIAECPICHGRGLITYQNPDGILYARKCSCRKPQRSTRWDVRKAPSDWQGSDEAYAYDRDELYISTAAAEA